MFYFSTFFLNLDYSTDHLQTLSYIFGYLFLKLLITCRILFTFFSHNLNNPNCFIRSFYLFDFDWICIKYDWNFHQCAWLWFKYDLTWHKYYWACYKYYLIWLKMNITWLVNGPKKIDIYILFSKWGNLKIVCFQKLRIITLRIFCLSFSLVLGTINFNCILTFARNQYDQPPKDVIINVWWACLTPTIQGYVKGCDKI